MTNAIAARITLSGWVPLATVLILMSMGMAGCVGDYIDG